MELESLCLVFHEFDPLLCSAILALTPEGWREVIHALHLQRVLGPSTLYSSGTRSSISSTAPILLKGRQRQTPLLLIWKPHSKCRGFL